MNEYAWRAGVRFFNSGIRRQYKPAAEHSRNIPSNSFQALAFTASSCIAFTSLSTAAGWVVGAVVEGMLICDVRVCVDCMRLMGQQQYMYIWGLDGVLKVRVADGGLGVV